MDANGRLHFKANQAFHKSLITFLLIDQYNNALDFP